MFVNFSDLPKNQNLFLDYLYEFENVSDFFVNDFRNKENYLKIFKDISDSRKNRELDLSSILLNQYQNLPQKSEKTLQNIQHLNSNKTIAVTTGQQLGILGGPLYTIYKIITAIKLVKQLNERYSDFYFVPVFWLEGDDHDFNEIRWIKIFNSDNSTSTLEYLESINEEEAKISVGNIKLQKEISDFIDGLKSTLRETEFTNNLLNQLQSFYVEGKTIKQAFKELIFWLFDNKGLVIFDPQDGAVKELLKPIFTKEINNFREHTEKLVLTSAKLEEVYHAQVKVKPVNLFLSVDEGRYSIEPVDDEFRLRRKRKNFKKEELLELIENNPSKFSPNVLLRPICQDYLFPTGFYIAGPSEIAYFAQIMPLYELFGIAAPIIFPRSSVTLVEKGIQTSLEKFELKFEDILINPEGLKDNVLSSISDDNLDASFDEVKNQIDLAFDKLKEKLFSIDKTLADSSNRYRDKINYQVNDLQNKSTSAQKKRHEISLRQIDKISEALYPDQNLQEREINFTYFYNKYGPEFIGKLFEEISISNFEHQLIEL